MEISFKEQLYKGERDLSQPLPVRLRILLPGEKELIREIGLEITSEVFGKIEANTTKAFTNPDGLDDVSSAKSRIETSKKRIEAIALVLKEQKRRNRANLGKVIDHATAFKRRERPQFKDVLSNPLRVFDAEAAVNAALGTIKDQQNKVKVIAGDTPKTDQALVVHQAVDTKSTNGTILEIITPKEVDTTNIAQQSLSAPADHIIVSGVAKTQQVILGGFPTQEITFENMRELKRNNPEFFNEAIAMTIFKDQIKRGKNGKKKLTVMDTGRNFIQYALERIYITRSRFGEDREQDCKNIINVLIEFLKFKGLVQEDDPDPYLAFDDTDGEFMEEFYNWMRNSKEEKLAQSTASMYLRTLKTFFNAAADNDCIINNHYHPFRGDDKFEIPYVEEIDRTLSPEELAKLLTYVPQRQRHKGWGSEGEAMRWVRRILRSGGMNPMDWVSLPKEAVQKGSFTYRRAKIEKRKKGSGMKITVPITPELLEDMEADRQPDNSDSEYYFSYLDMTEEEKEELANVQAEPGLTRERACERRYNAIVRRKTSVIVNRVDRWLHKICKKLGLSEKITIYWLRHTFAQLAIDSGMPETRLRQILGHRGQKSLGRYTYGKVTKQALKNMVNIVDSAFKPLKFEELDEVVNEDEVTVSTIDLTPAKAINPVLAQAS